MRCASGRLDVAAAALEDATAILRTAVERTRRMTFELRPPLLEAQGLAAAVSELTSEVARECGFQATLDLNVGRHSRGVEDLAYRTVKEALANVRKHAEAGRVRVRLADGDGQLWARSPTTAAGSRSSARSTAARCGCTWGWTRCASGLRWPAAGSTSSPRRARARLRFTIPVSG